MRYETFIALRYLRSRRRSGFISIITWFSIGGVAIGVAALAIVLSAMNGLETEVRQKILDTDAHLKVVRFHDLPIEGDAWPALIDTIWSVDGVIGVTPFIETEGLISGNQQTTAVIRGIDPATADDVYRLTPTVEWGSMDLGIFTKKRLDTDTFTVDYAGIIVGYNLSQQVGNVGQEGTLAILPKGDDASIFMGMPSVRMKNFKISGVFRTGLYEYDIAYVYMGLETAQDLMGYGQKITGLSVRLDDMWDVNRVDREIEDLVPWPYTCISWIDQNKNLFAWMTIEKWLMFLVLGLIIMVAAFNIISTLIMVVLEKKKDIGILKAMGATRKGIQRIFTYQGMIVGVVGTIIGLILGYGFCWAQQTFRLISIPPDVYFIDAVPIDMRWLDFILIVSLSLLLSLLASVYPARRAAALVPVEAMRNE
ncbi:FtsX-like permease family protein [Candidatus Zixiibacteriota bacterium]